MPIWLQSILRSRSGKWGIAVLLLQATNNVISYLSNAEFVANHVGDALRTLTTPLGNLVVLVLGGALILWASRSQQRDAYSPAESQPKSATLQPAPANTDSSLWEEINRREAEHKQEKEELEYANQQLQQNLEAATADAGLPPDVATERDISNCSFRIIDLLKLAGTDDCYIVGKNFKNCTIRGPGVITREGVPPSLKGQKGAFALPTVSHVPTLYVEGSPDSVLYEVRPNAVAASGLIHLVGCGYERVTFSGVGIAGSPEEIEWWRQNCTFSEPPPSE